MRRILVTGANKGIGFAIAEGILREHDDTFVILGSRSLERGRGAVERIAGEDAARRERVHVLELDVARDASVERARDHVGEAFGSLYGLVNNAGVGARGRSLAEVLEVNTVGVHRMCESFLGLLERPGGRIVNVTSASGPSFVERCSAEWQRFFLDRGTDWAALRRFMDECIALDGDEKAFSEKGLGDGDAYGLSKACANAYTQHLATLHPDLCINACTPGFIETDMTRRYAESSGKSPAELGMKPPREGARTPIYLLFGPLEGNGRYYGSDAKRSPLDRYRAPGTPAYEGP